MARQTLSDLRHRRGGPGPRQPSSKSNVRNIILFVTLGTVGLLWFVSFSVVAPPDPYVDSEILGQTRKEVNGYANKDSNVMRRQKAGSQRFKNAHDGLFPHNFGPIVNAPPNDVAVDPLRSTDVAMTNLPRKPLPFKPAVPYLGVLIDGGRRYFPISWLMKVVDRLADMNYNLIHLRLTDDQTFNVLLDSHPELAFPTSADNPEKKVYSVKELRALTAYAKTKNIRIMPEINVPGHAGSWAGVPGLIVHCPEFICDKGYGIPINVTHPALRPILTDVITEIVDIFDDPPFIHLGGDEVNMAGPCFDEVGEKVFDYEAFERVLKAIIKDVGFPEDRIVRWEMTGQANLERAGKIEQFWESHPCDRHCPEGPFFVSTWMYFDSNGDENSHTVVTKSNKSFHLKNGKLPVAIIAGTFELSVQFWFERNILGRLLSVAMGASNLTFTNRNENVIGAHKRFCNELGFGQTVCDKEGAPMIPTDIYHVHWKADWVLWKADICQRLTNVVPHRAFLETPNMYLVAVLAATHYYWNNFPLMLAEKGVRTALPSGQSDDLAKLRKHVVPHTGLILDTVNSIVQPSRISDIIVNDVAKLGFTMVQMRLITNAGYSLKTEDSNFEFSYATGSAGATPYRLKEDIAPLVATARRLGIEMMPEISVSSDGGGWFLSGLMMPCPMHFCKSTSTPLNVNDPQLLPVLFKVIAELRKVFSSRYLHLGSDERAGSEPCFKELMIKPDFDSFERKLTKLLETNGILPDHILRHDNMHHKKHEGRTGTITQHRAGSDTMEEPDDIVFFTVDVEDGDAWAVYQRTKKLVAEEPLGIMAEVRALLRSHWNNVQLSKRLLAFSMALSELPTAEDPNTFAESFQAICQALSLDNDCTPPGKLPVRTSYSVDTPAFRQKMCEARTTESSKHVAKFVPPFYKSIVEAKAANSKVAA